MCVWVWVLLLWQFALLFGPGQVLGVCMAPVAWLALVPQPHAGDAGGESAYDTLAHGHEAQALAMRWYCLLRTGVTYILAVLVSHLFTFALSDRIFSRRAGADVGGSSSVASASGNRGIDIDTMEDGCEDIGGESEPQSAHSQLGSGSDNKGHVVVPRPRGYHEADVN
jgi:hypothetical protein